MTAQNHHYFASHALGWATADTKEEAIEKLWHGQHTDIRKWLSNAQKEGSLGLNFFVCRVPLSNDANYSINFYCPVVDGLTETANYYLTHYTQKKIAWAADPEDKVRKAEAKAENIELALFNLSYAIVTEKSFHDEDVQKAIEAAKPLISYLQEEHDKAVAEDAEVSRKEQAAGC